MVQPSADVHVNIRLRGLNHRGKNRIREHGDTFEFIMHGDPKISRYMNEKDILVKSLDGAWTGWFTTGQEVEIVDD